ncbi:hypothetical protein AB3N58_01880 [Leptospira sp. WS60.C2]
MRISASAENDLYSEYETKKKSIHNYMVHPNGRIDRHKIAATFVHSILKIHPITGASPQSDYDLRFSKAEFLPNEVFAWHCGISIVFSFLMEELQKNKQLSIRQRLEEGFKYPPCSHDDYQIHVLRSLYHAKVKGTFDIFSFSHVFYLIEEYNKLILQVP